MANPPETDSKVTILPPDRSLQKKIGTADLGRILSPEAIGKAQDVIASAADAFLQESLAETEKLENLLQSLEDSKEKNREALRNMTAAAFNLRSKAGLGGYDLVANLARSLHRYGEQIAETQAAAVNTALMAWHIDSIKRLLNLGVKGMGGELGAAIMVELNRLNTPPDA